MCKSLKRGRGDDDEEKARLRGKRDEEIEISEHLSLADNQHVNEKFTISLSGYICGWV